MSSGATSPTAGGERLRRSLRLIDVAALGLNGVIGTGIFFLPGEAAALLGPASLVPFLISAVLCSLVVLCFAEVSSRFDATGGPMLYAAEAFGTTAGFVVGWLTWLTRLTAWAALANALLTATASLVPGVMDYRIVFLVSTIGVLAVVNVFGVSLGASVMNVVTVAKLLPIVALIGVGVFWIRGDLFVPFAPRGLGDMGEATLIILYAFVGFELLTVLAGETREPTRVLPRALLIVMVVTTAVYLLLWAVCTGTLPELAGAASPVADAAAVVLGSRGGAVMALAILVSAFGVNAACALVAPRCLYVLAHRRMLPAPFGWVHHVYRTPVVAIVVTAGLTLALAISGSFVQLAVLSVIARLTQYVTTCAAMLWFRARRPAEAPDFRAPGGAVTAVSAISLCGWLLFEGGVGNLLWGAIAVAVGLGFHLPLRWAGRGAEAPAGPS